MPRLVTIVGHFHDDYDLLREKAERDMFPRLDPKNTADAQIMEMIGDIVTCLKMRRIELSGYSPKESE
jgi:hypothetical protein